MSDLDLDIREPPNVLVPLAVLEGQTIPETLIEFLSPANVVILGYHVLPEQTPTEQGSMQFEDRAQSAVEAIAEAFEKEGATVETRVAFTHDLDQTIDRIATEVNATATLLPNPAGAIDNVLVPIRGVIDTNRLADLVATLAGAGFDHVTLWGLPSETTEADVARRLEAAGARLAARGLSPDQITTETTVSKTPVIDIVDRSSAFDVIVMGQGSESWVSMFLGDAENRVAEGAVAPVLVVRPAPDPDTKETNA